MVADHQCLFGKLVKLINICFSFACVVCNRLYSGPLNLHRDQIDGGFMNKRMVRIFSLVLGVVLVGALAAWAQQARRPAAAASKDRAVLKVRRIVGVGKPSLVRTPEYKADVPRGSARNQQWGQVLVEYETAPDWVDELTFQHFVLAVKMEDGKRKMSLYKLVVRYVDVEKGTHLSTVYLKPSALKRFGEVVAVAVEITADGNPAGEAVDQSVKLQEKWWRDPQVLENPDIVLREGYLVDRLRSPFAYVNIDDYEDIR